jgi:predicted Zn-dependent peptidase
MKQLLLPILQGTRLGLGLAVGLLVPTIMIAQLDRSRPPAPGPPPVVHLGEYSSFTLGNGMRVIVVENHKLPLVGVQVKFDIPPVVQGDKAGYVEIVGDMLAAGTGLRTKVQLDEEIDRLGATLVTANDGIFCSGLKKNLPAIMTIAQDVVTNSTFPDKELDRIKVRYASSVKQRKDDPDAIAETIGRSVTFGRTHPYGEVMTEQSIANIKRDHINGYYQRFFRPDAGYLVFVGDITEKEAKDLAKKHFGKWKVPQVAVPNEDGSETVPGLGVVQTIGDPLGPAGVRRVVMVDRPGSAQSVIRVTLPLNLHPKDLRTMSAQVMNTILGGGVFNARLMQNLRETKAFTYGAHSNLEIDRFNGSFTAAASVRTEVTDSAVMEVMRELDRMRNEPVTADELELAKNYMAGSFARSLEDPRTVARFALNTFLNGLPDDHYATYLKRLEKITAADVEAAAKAFLHPDNAVIFVVGDRERIQSKLTALNGDPSAQIIVLDENGDIFREQVEQVHDKTAEQVIEDYLKAIGGREAIGSIKQMYKRMRTKLGGMNITIEEWHGPNGEFRSKTTAEKMGVLQEVIFDGQRAVSISPQGREELTDIDLWDVIAGSRPVPEMDPSVYTERMTLAGIVTIYQDEKAYKVVISTKGGSSITDHFATNSDLKNRRVEQKFAMGKPMTITSDLLDYRPVNGVKFPHLITQSGGPMGEVQIIVDEISVNEPVATDFFQTGLPPIPED